MLIGIIGIGLIGSSLARAFRGQGEVGIYDISALHMEQAKKLGLGARYFDSARALAAEADIIFVCVPAGSIVEVVREIAPHLKKGAIVSDVGSVKSSITRAVLECLPKENAFVPGHPIAGTEHSGPEAGNADLFRDKIYILDDRQDKDAAEKIAVLLRKIGAAVVFLDANKHDLILAFTSHLPHICAFSAMHCSEQVSQSAGQNAIQFAGGSFRDMTRVAASSAEMWQGIFLGNSELIVEAYKIFRKEADHMVSLIEAGDAALLTTYLEGARGLRLKHYPKEKA